MENEIKSLRMSGFTLQEIGDRFGVSRQRIHQVLADGGFVRAHPKTLFKVIRADYWAVGIYMDGETLERDFLKHGCFDPQAILERNGKRYHVRRMANGSQRLEALT